MVYLRHMKHHIIVATAVVAVLIVLAVGYNMVPMQAMTVASPYSETIPELQMDEDGVVVQTPHYAQYVPASTTQDRIDAVELNDRIRQMAKRIEPSDARLIM